MGSLWSGRSGHVGLSARSRFSAGPAFPPCRVSSYPPPNLLYQDAPPSRSLVVTSASCLAHARPQGPVVLGQVFCCCVLAWPPDGQHAHVPERLLHVRVRPLSLPIACLEHPLSVSRLTFSLSYACSVCCCCRSSQNVPGVARGASSSRPGQLAGASLGDPVLLLGEQRSLDLRRVWATRLTIFLSVFALLLRLPRRCRCAFSPLFAEPLPAGPQVGSCLVGDLLLRPRQGPPLDAGLQPSSRSLVPGCHRWTPRHDRARTGRGGGRAERPPQGPAPRPSLPGQGPPHRHARPAGHHGGRPERRPTCRARTRSLRMD